MSLPSLVWIGPEILQLSFLERSLSRRCLWLWGPSIRRVSPSTARRPGIPPQLPPRTPQPSRPRQPSLVGFPVRTARQPCVHHDPLWPRHNIPTAYLPNLALETPPSRVTSVSSPLSVPSHSRSLGRPPISICPGRGTSIPRSPTRKSSRQSLPRSRRPRDYQHTAHGLKYRQHPAARWPQNWSHRQRTPSLGRRPTRHWHHALWCHLYSGQWTPQQSRLLCRSSSPGCQTCERAHVPRTPPNTTLQTCRASHRSWWPLEPGSHNLPTVVGPSKSPNHPSPAQGLIHECLDLPKSPMQPWPPMRPVCWNLTASRAPSQTATTLSPVRCWLKPPSPPPPAASQPAPKEQWLGLGPVSLHIPSRRYINGTCLEAAQYNSSNQTQREKKGARKKKTKLERLQGDLSHPNCQ